jgi:hypothetical protein
MGSLRCWNGATIYERGFGLECWHDSIRKESLLSKPTDDLLVCDNYIAHHRDKRRRIKPFVKEGDDGRTLVSRGELKNAGSAQRNKLLAT